MIIMSTITTNEMLKCFWSSSSFSKLATSAARRCFSSSSSAAAAAAAAAAVRCSLQSPDVPRLADTARISLTPKEVDDFAPKIRQVIDWFGQLQAIDLESIEPTLRADTEAGNGLRLDSVVTFENREALLAAVPSYEEQYIKVPKVLNKE